MTPQSGAMEETRLSSTGPIPSWSAEKSAIVMQRSENIRQVPDPCLKLDGRLRFRSMEMVTLTSRAEARAMAKIPIRAVDFMVMMIVVLENELGWVW